MFEKTTNPTEPFEKDNCQPFTWTDEAPTEEGFYWYREKEHDLRGVVQVFDRPNPGLSVNGLLYERQPVNSLDGQWAGPIPPPKQPLHD
jgi:hypothetical protein